MVQHSPIPAQPDANVVNSHRLNNPKNDDPLLWEPVQAELSHV
jgi:hypothetical protein